MLNQILSLGGQQAIRRDDILNQLPHPSHATNYTAVGGVPSSVVADSLPPQCLLARRRQSVNRVHQRILRLTKVTHRSCGCKHDVFLLLWIPDHGNPVFRVRDPLGRGVDGRGAVLDNLVASQGMLPVLTPLVPEMPVVQLPAVRAR